MKISNSTNKKLWFKTGVASILIAIVVFTILLYKGSKNIENRLIRFEAPSEISLELSNGSFSIYHEYKTFLNSNVYNQSKDSINDLSLELIAEDGSIINLNYAVNKETYSFNHRNGYSLASFNIQNSGVYTLKSNFNSSDSTKFVLAIGHDVFEALFKSIVLSIIVFITLLSIGIILILKSLAISRLK